MTTEPAIERLPDGGHGDGPGTSIRMYGKECKVYGTADRWVVEAPFAFETWRMWAVSDSRDAALVLAGEYLRESRDR
jgi:hypothetical protein